MMTQLLTWRDPSHTIQHPLHVHPERKVLVVEGFFRKVVPMPQPQDSIRALEEQLLVPEIRASAQAVGQILAEGFVEFGSSGRVYDRAATLAALAGGASPATGTLEDFRVTVVAPQVALATYRLNGVLRSSLWVKQDAAWRILFHQGTPAAPRLGS